jgi:hypothetical protein
MKCRYVGLLISGSSLPLIWARKSMVGLVEMDW